MRALTRLLIALFAIATSLYTYIAFAKNVAPVKATTTTAKASVGSKVVPTSKTTTTSRAGGSFYTSDVKSVNIAGDRNLYYGKIGDNSLKTHTVLDSKGIPRYVRGEGGHEIVQETRAIGKGFVNGVEVAAKKANIIPEVASTAARGVILDVVIIPPPKLFENKYLAPYSPYNSGKGY